LRMPKERIDAAFVARAAGSADTRLDALPRREQGWMDTAIERVRQQLDWGPQADSQASRANRSTP
jgi:hypothetical protein